MLVSVTTIGQRTKLARSAKGWTAAEFARRVGTSNSVISRFEGGDRGKAPTAETINKYAGVLGVSTEWLLTGRGPMVANQGTGQETERDLAGRVALGGGISDEAVRIVMTHPQAPEPNARPALWWLRWMLSVEAQLAMRLYQAMQTAQQHPPPSGPLTPTQPSLTLPTHPPPSPDPVTQPRLSSPQAARNVPAEMRETKRSHERPDSKPKSTPRRK